MKFLFGKGPLDFLWGEPKEGGLKKEGAQKAPRKAPEKSTNLLWPKPKRLYSMPMEQSINQMVELMVDIPKVIDFGVTGTKKFP